MSFYNPTPNLYQANWSGNPKVATLNQFSTLQGQIDNLSNVFVTSTIFTSSIFISSVAEAVTISSFTASISSLISVSFSTQITNTLQINLSTLAFNPSFSNLIGRFEPKVELGMGGLVGSLLGQLGSGALTLGTGIGGLATGLAAIALPRGSKFINNNLSSLTFETVAGTSQLQVSTLGDAYPLYSTIFRTVSSVSANQVPGPEIFLSSFFYPGTLCIRSVSDPLDIVTDEFSGSTIQSFGQWTVITDISGGGITPYPVFSNVIVTYENEPGIYATKEENVIVYNPGFLGFSTQTFPYVGDSVFNVSSNDLFQYPVSTIKSDSENDLSGASIYLLEQNETIYDLNLFFFTDNGGIDPSPLIIDTQTFLSDFDILIANYNYLQPGFCNVYNQQIGITFPDTQTFLLPKPNDLEYGESTIRCQWDYVNQIATVTDINENPFFSTVSNFQSNQAFALINEINASGIDVFGSPNFFINASMVGIGFSGINALSNIFYSGYSPPVQSAYPFGAPGLFTEVIFTSTINGSIATFDEIFVSSQTVLNIVSTIVTDTDLINVSTLNAENIFCQSATFSSVLIQDTTFDVITGNYVDVNVAVRLLDSNTPLTPNGIAYIMILNSNFGSTSPNLCIEYNSSPSFFVESLLNINGQTSSVGINLSNPQYDLDVAGITRTHGLIASSINIQGDGNPYAINTSAQYVFQNIKAYAQTMIQLPASFVATRPDSLTWAMANSGLSESLSTNILLSAGAAGTQEFQFNCSNTGTQQVDLTNQTAYSFTIQTLTNPNFATVGGGQRSRFTLSNGQPVSLLASPPEQIVPYFNNLNLSNNQGAYYIDDVGSTYPGNILQISMPVALPSVVNFASQLNLRNSFGSNVAVNSGIVTFQQQITANFLVVGGVVEASATNQLQTTILGSNYAFPISDWTCSVCLNGFQQGATAFAFGQIVVAAVSSGGTNPVYSVQCYASGNISGPTSMIWTVTATMIPDALATITFVP